MLNMTTLGRGTERESSQVHILGPDVRLKFKQKVKDLNI